MLVRVVVKMEGSKGPPSGRYRITLLLGYGAILK